MANSNAQIRVMGGDGNIYNIYPQTKIENVDGLQTALEAKGTYIKPSGGIPKTDLSSAVQTSLGKADTALQSFTETDPTVPAWAKAASKPTYTASDVGAIATTAKGAASGVAELDANGKVPSSQLPAYVDDVLEYTAKSSFPTTGETGKIYVDTTTNLTYRWSGSAYVEISPSLALGTTSSTAYRGDRGNTAYSHATDSSRLTTAQSSGLYKIATTAQGHIASVTAVSKSDITNLGIPGSDTNTHRPIQVNGTQVLGDNTTALNLKAGSNVNISNSSGTVTIAATDTTYSAATQSANGLMSSTDKTKLDGIATGATAVSESTVSGWGFTKNTGTYSKPSTGIPKTDLASAVQTSLGKADSALQSHQTIKQDGITGATVNRFGTCGTAAATAAKTVSITTGTFSLEAGARVSVKFTYANTAGTPTLNVNSTGAKNIYSKGSQITTGSNKSLLAGTVDFIYDGTQWHLIGNYIDTNTTYSAATQSANGLMSSTDKTKLDGIATGAQVNSIIGVKGNSESSYRTGNVNITPANIGLGNVGNFKAVSTVASQGLSDTEKSNARANIGAGTSSLALGTSSSTAYRGDYGNTAYSHATDSGRLTTATSSGLYKVASTAQGHIASLSAVTKSDITGLGIPGSDTNTHRPIQINGTQLLGNNDTPFNLSASGNVIIKQFTGEPNRAHIYNENWVVRYDLTVVLNNLTWNTTANGMGYSSTYYPDFGDYPPRYLIGCSIRDFNTLTPIFILPCISDKGVWFMSESTTFPSGSYLELRAFGLLYYDDVN